MSRLRRFGRMWMDANFYRDIFTNLIASGITLGTGIVWAIGAGYIKTPTGIEMMRGIGNVAYIVGGFVFASVIFFWAMFFKQNPEHPRWRRIFRRCLWIVAMYVLCGSTFQAMTGAFNDSWLFPFNTSPWHVPIVGENP